MCIRESFIQGSGFAFFIVSLKLPRFAVWDPVIEISVSYSFWNPLLLLDQSSLRNVLTVAPVSRFAFTLSELSSEKELADCCTSVRNLHAIQHQSSHHSIHPNSSCRSIREDSIRPPFCTGS